MQSPAAVTELKRLTDEGFMHSEDGQDLLEYGLLMALIAVFAMGAISVLGNTITGVFWTAIASSF